MKENKKQTILITGTSTGIGNTTAIYLAELGYKVYASMRKINSDLYKKYENIIPVELIITDLDSIKKCLSTIEKNNDKIDILINNSGYGELSPFENTNYKEIQSMFDVNLFGMLNLTKALLPGFRKQRHGKIINISSVGGRMSYPFYSIYHSTKWAVEGFSESLYYELAPFNIQVKLIEPGATKSNFFQLPDHSTRKEGIKDYENLINKFKSKSIKTFENAIDPREVSKEIYNAIIDTKGKLRFPVGNNKSKFILFLLKILPNHFFIQFMKKSLEK